MEFVRAAGLTELQPDSMIKVHVRDRDILLANCSGSFFALNNRCPHMGGSLADGKLEGHIVTCPRHGTQIDVRNGKIIQNARLLFISMTVKDAESFPVRVEGSDILVGF